MRFHFLCVKCITFTAVAAITAAMFCGCQKVSEDVYINDITQTTQTETDITETETTTSVKEETVVSSENALQDKTTVVEQETAPVTEKVTETVAETEETTVTQTSETEPTDTEAVEMEETKEETTAAEETTVTIQTESPLETAVVTVIKVPVQITEKQTEASEEIYTEQTVQESKAVEYVRPEVYGQNYYSSLNYSEQKGVWISYLEYDSIMKNKSEESFRESVRRYFDNVKALDFNTVYVQVRAYGDAYYESDLFPSGDRFNGTMGTSEDYDALEIMIEEAHSRGLSVHAWINPMRLMTDNQIKGLSDSFKVKQWYNDSDKNGKYIVSSGGRWYLNPAYSEVVQLISDGITEIVAEYDVDGVQIDDYFYPTTDKSFDSSAYSASGTGLSLSEWRVNNVNSMVKKLFNAVHAANPSAVFGISPQGNVDNNYKDLYADVKLWCSEKGYCDYILPQIYFGFDNETLPYAETVALWNSMTNGSGVKLVIGLAAYKSGTEDNYAGEKGKNEWINNSDILARQMECAAEARNYGGVAIFRYDSLFAPSSSVAKQVSLEVDNIKKIG